MVKSFTGADDIELVSLLDGALTVDIVEGDLPDNVLWLIESNSLGVLLVDPIFHGRNVCANIDIKFTLFLERQRISSGHSSSTSAKLENSELLALEMIWQMCELLLQSIYISCLHSLLDSSSLTNGIFGSILELSLFAFWIESHSGVICTVENVVELHGVF